MAKNPRQEYEQRKAASKKKKITDKPAYRSGQGSGDSTGAPGNPVWLD